MTPMPNVLLFGPTGSGKTTSLKTIIQAGLELFVVHTEAPGVQTLAGLPPDKYHSCYIPPAKVGWDTMIQAAGLINRSSWAVLKEMTNDPQKAKYDGFLRMLNAFSNFTDDETGEEFGDISTWGHDRAIAVDSLSGLNQHSMQLVTGNPVSRSQPQWGAAMSNELNLMNKLCRETNCLFVMIAHVERLINELDGTMLLRPSALGKANAPEIPKEYTDIIYTERQGREFSWSTAKHNTDLKAANVPIGDKLTPSFVPLIKRWKEQTNNG